jgi:hypothetical protein
MSHEPGVAARNIRRIKSPASRNPAAPAPTTGTCASRHEEDSCGCRSRWRTNGVVRERGQAESREADLRCHTARGPRSTPDIRSRSRSESHRGFRRSDRRGCSARSDAPSGGRRSIPGDPFFDPAGSWALHRRGGRATPRPGRHARAQHPIGARRQPCPRPQGEGRWRSLSRPPAHDAEADADEHGLRAARLPEAPPRARVHRPAELGPHFSGWHRVPAAAIALAVPGGRSGWWGFL